MTTSPVTDHPSCPPEHGPAVPWTRVEKARIFLGYWAFRALEAVVHLLRDMTAGRINLFWTTGNDGRATWSRLGHFWHMLAAEGYLYDDLKRGTLPPKHVQDGVTRWG